MRINIGKWVFAVERAAIDTARNVCAVEKTPVIIITEDREYAAEMRLREENPDRRDGEV